MPCCGSCMSRSSCRTHKARRRRAGRHCSSLQPLLLLLLLKHSWLGNSSSSSRSSKSTWLLLLFYFVALQLLLQLLLDLLQLGGYVGAWTAAPNCGFNSLLLLSCLVSCRHRSKHLLLLSGRVQGSTRWRWVHPPHLLRTLNRT